MASPIPSNWQVPDIFRERMGSQVGRQRCMTHDGHLLLIVHDIPAPDTPGKRDGRLFWRRPDGSWQTGGAGPPTIAPLRALVERFTQVAADLDARSEEAHSAEDWFTLIQAAAPVLRTARNLHRTLQEAREAAKSDRDLIILRDLAGEAERAFELIHAHAQQGLEYTTARRAEEQAQGAQHMLEAAHRLNMIAAVFLPVTAVATLLGMNLRHGLEGWPAPWTFWITLVLASAFGLWIKASMPRPPPPPEPTSAPPRDKHSKTGTSKGR